MVIDDAELTTLALAADPDQPIDPGAAPFLPWAPDGEAIGDLPGWYMAPAITTSPRRWHRPIGILLIAANVLIPAFGCCITYGALVLA